MQDEIIYLNWQYDYWDDIQKWYPVGMSIICKVTKVTRNYAFLKTDNHLNCFVSKKNCYQFQIQNFEDELELEKYYDCRIEGYNEDKQQLIVSLML